MFLMYCNFDTVAAVADISPLMPLAWTTALLSSTTLPAWADEAAAPVEAAAEGVQQAAAAVTEAAADAAPAPSWLSYIGESPARLLQAGRTASLVCCSRIQ
jgi:hypothetical protein